MPKNEYNRMLLGCALLSWLHISVLVIMLFGPTREIVAMFSLVLATEFSCDRHFAARNRASRARR